MRERCRGKNDFEILIEYLKLRDELVEELNRRECRNGKNSEGVVVINDMLKELDKIAHFFIKCRLSSHPGCNSPAIIPCFT